MMNLYCCRNKACCWPWKLDLDLIPQLEACPRCGNPNVLEIGLAPAFSNPDKLLVFAREHFEEAEWQDWHARTQSTDQTAWRQAHGWRVLIDPCCIFVGPEPDARRVWASVLRHLKVPARVLLMSPDGTEAENAVVDAAAHDADPWDYEPVGEEERFKDLEYLY